jgi:hypothetical protein
VHWCGDEYSLNQDRVHVLRRRRNLDSSGHVVYTRKIGEGGGRGGACRGESAVGEVWINPEAIFVNADVIFGAEVLNVEDPVLVVQNAQSVRGI